MSKELVDAMVNMKEKEAIGMAKDLIDGGQGPMNILNACKEAMEIVGSRFEKGEFFLPELVMAGEMLRQISEFVKPKLKGKEKTERLGRVIIGTVEGDIHDIGKDIVVFMLDVNGFEVLDLGIDVPVQKFVDSIKDFQPSVIGLSGFLTLAFDSMKSTVDAITEAGLRDKVRIMIGGGQIDEEIRKYSGADAYGTDAMDAVKLAKQWTGTN
ncbi:MAG: cobalamin-dependent protein [Deltaproteobacteria bacterium]|nr:cobalamin-dependent protein [Deltaproteobacteria bacterium]MBW2137443.1 cobalamin-dependent protein [Deltaproteobacteria bacterium]